MMEGSPPLENSGPPTEQPPAGTELTPPAGGERLVIQEADLPAEKPRTIITVEGVNGDPEPLPENFEQHTENRGLGDEQLQAKWDQHIDATKVGDNVDTSNWVSKPVALEGAHLEDEAYNLNKKAEVLENINPNSRQTQAQAEAGLTTALADAASIPKEEREGRDALHEQQREAHRAIVSESERNRIAEAARREAGEKVSKAEKLQYYAKALEAHFPSQDWIKANLREAAYQELTPSFMVEIERNAIESRATAEKIRAGLARLEADYSTAKQKYQEMMERGDTPEPDEDPRFSLRGELQRKIEDAISRLSLEAMRTEWLDLVDSETVSLPTVKEFYVRICNIVAAPKDEQAAREERFLSAIVEGNVEPRSPTTESPAQVEAA